MEHRTLRPPERLERAPDGAGFRFSRARKTGRREQGDA